VSDLEKKRIKKGRGPSRSLDLREEFRAQSQLIKEGWIGWARITVNGEVNGQKEIGKTGHLRISGQGGAKKQKLGPVTQEVRAGHANISVFI